MAKKSKEKSEPEVETEPPAVPIGHSYRIDKIDMYNWQSIRTIFFSDGTFREEHPFKADVLEIVTRKLFSLMREEATKRFAQIKAEKLEREKALAEEAAQNAQE